MKIYNKKLLKQTAFAYIISISLALASQLPSDKEVPNEGLPQQVQISSDLLKVVQVMIIEQKHMYERLIASEREKRELMQKEHNETLKLQLKLTKQEQKRRTRKLLREEKREQYVKEKLEQQKVDYKNKLNKRTTKSLEKSNISHALGALTIGATTVLTGGLAPVVGGILFGGQVATGIDSVTTANKAIKHRRKSELVLREEARSLYPSSESEGE